MVGRLLILSAPFGSGHHAAAQAVAQGVHCLTPECDVTVSNVGGPLVETVSSSYLTLLQRVPGAYRRLYYADVGPTIRGLIRSVWAAGVKRKIAETRPRAVVATHPFPASAAAYLRRRGQLDVPVHVVVTDFVPHPIWVHEGVDQYYTASDQTASALQSMGVPQERITVSGIPITPFPPAPERSPESQSVKRVLVMGGGLGLGPITEAVRSLSTTPFRQMETTVVCGSNQALVQDLTDLFCDDSRFTIMGYSNQVPALMAKADLLVTKPGGLTCSEALGAALPMLLLKPLPGQEEDNAHYLTALGAAQRIEEDQLGSVATELLVQAPEKLARMREQALVHGRPLAAVHIAHHILQWAAGPNLIHAKAWVPSDDRRRCWTHVPHRAAGG